VTRSACLPRSELEEARLHVARWIGSQSQAARRLSDRRGRRGRRALGRAARRRWAARPGRADRAVRRAGARGDRVDDRRAVRARHLGAAGLGGVDRRRAEGQGTGAAGVQDRQDRRAGPRGALAPRSGAGDLAARSESAARARAGALPAAPGQAQVQPEVPHPLDDDHTPARSPTCSVSPAASCSIGFRSRSHGAARSTPASS